MYIALVLLAFISIVLGIYNYVFTKRKVISRWEKYDRY